MPRKFFSIILILVIFSAVPLSAQTVDEILKQYYEARGGYEKIKSVQTMKTTGKQMVQGIEVPFTFQQKRPNFLHIEATVQGQSIIQGYNGKTAWMINPLTGSTDPQTLPDEQATQIIEQADIDGHLVDYKDKGHTVELIGKEDMEGTEVYKLKVTLKNGDVRYDFLDAEYFLELKVLAKIKRQDTEIEAETFISDYKEVEGMMMAHSFETKRGGATVSQIAIDSVAVDVEMDDAIFKMPVAAEKKEEPKQ